MDVRKLRVVAACADVVPNAKALASTPDETRAANASLNAD